MTLVVRLAPAALYNPFKTMLIYAVNIAGNSQNSPLRYLIVPPIILFFIIFSFSRDDSGGSIEFANVPCSSTVVIAKDFGASSLSTGTQAPERQLIVSLNQTAMFSKSGQLPGLSSHSLFSYNADTDLLRLYEDEIKYDLIISSTTNRAPPLFIS
jgi:hypothetical protein